MEMEEGAVVGGERGLPASGPGTITSSRDRKRRGLEVDTRN